MSVHRFDRMIDNVAREMTAGEPPADLRVRTIAALSSQTARPAGWMWPSLAAAAAVLIAAWLVAPRTSLPGVANPDAPVVTATAPAASPTSTFAAPSPAESTNAVSRPRTGGHARTVKTTTPDAEELAWLARALPPLSAPKGVELAPIQPSALTIAPITVDPIGSDRQIDRR